MLNKLILVLNCGSSSLKFALINVKNNKEYFYGMVDYLDSSNCLITWSIKKNNFSHKLFNSSYKTSINFIYKNILKKYLSNNDKIYGIGHRIVHGGKYFNKSVLIDKNVLKKIKKLIPLAPLHNPYQLTCIKETIKFFPELKNKNVAVFDTAFHQTISEEIYLYAIPYKISKKYSIRKYGAHGISNLYILKQTSLILNKKIKKLNIIICHLGNGASISVIKNGECIDTSMGFTPLDGLVMGTRSGDIDPSVIFYLYSIGFSISKINNILTKESGFLGLTNKTNDFRKIEKKYLSNKNAYRTVNIFCNRLIKYIGAYSALLGCKLDTVIFTGGIGENSSLIRKIVLNKLEHLNFKINDKFNIEKTSRKFKLITDKDSIPVFVMSSNENLIIAQDTDKLINLI